MHQIKTTPNVLRKQLRKKQIRKERGEREYLEAKNLGISVWELRFKKFQEGLQFKIHPIPIPSWVTGGWYRGYSSYY